MSSTSFPAGSRAVLHGLQSKPQLNNHLVVVEKELTEGSDRGRFRVRPLGSEAKRLAPTPHMSIKPSNLRLAPDSAFIAKIKYDGKELLLPLTCLADRDGFNKVGLHLMYSDFLGLEALVPVLKAFLGEHQWSDWSDMSQVRAVLEASPEYGIVTTPVHEDQVREGLQDDEILIVQSKHEQIYPAMIDYQIIKPLNKTTSVGFYGDVPLCKILFPFHADWRPASQRPQNNDVLEYLRSQGATVLTM